MSALQPPVIDPRQSYISAKQGGLVEFKPFAYNSPKLWAATGLKAGFTCDPLEGIIYGSTLIPGPIIFAAKAYNDAGWSAPEIFTIGIEENGIGSLDPAIDVVVDIATRLVTIAGVTATTKDVDPLFLGKSGDVMLLRITFTKNGVPIDIDLVTLKFGAKEFDPDTLIIESEIWRKQGAGASAYYELLLDLTADALKAALADVEGDDETEFDGRAEFEMTWVKPWGETNRTLRVSSLSFIFRFIRELVPNS